MPILKLTTCLLVLLGSDPKGINEYLEDLSRAQEKAVKLAGPNIVQGSEEKPRPWEVVAIGSVSFSADGSLVHYLLRRQNKKKDVGAILLGYFVDVSTGKVLRTYQVLRESKLPAEEEAEWRAAEPKAWGQQILQKHGFKKAHRYTKQPKGSKVRVKLSLPGVNMPMGFFLASWRISRRFAWTWRMYPKRLAAGTQFNGHLKLTAQRGGKKKVLHTHTPYLDYHYAIRHLAHWRFARKKANQFGGVCADKGDHLHDEECLKVLKEKGYLDKHQFAFKGETTIYWNAAGDALLAFWDDLQYMHTVVTPPVQRMVFRSVVTVHSLVDRAPSKLIPPKKKAAPMASKTTSTAMGQPMAGAAGDPMLTPMKASKAAKKKKKGCGCQTSAPSALALVPLLLALLWLGRRRR